MVASELLCNMHMYIADIRNKGLSSSALIPTFAFMASSVDKLRVAASICTILICLSRDSESRIQENVLVRLYVFELWQRRGGDWFTACLCGLHFTPMLPMSAFTAGVVCRDRGHTLLFLHQRRFQCKNNDLELRGISISRET